MTDDTEEAAEVTPYEVSSKFGSQDDYDRLIDKFGANRLNEDLLDRLRSHSDGELHQFFRRDIICSHRDFAQILDKYEEGDEFYLYTGRAPSGDLHLGPVLEELDPVLQSPEEGVGLVQGTGGFAGQEVVIGQAS